MSRNVPPADLRPARSLLLFPVSLLIFLLREPSHLLRGPSHAEQNRKSYNPFHVIPLSLADAIDGFSARLLPLPRRDSPAVVTLLPAPPAGSKGLSIEAKR